MPTPFTHLDIAERMLVHDQLSPSIKALILAHKPAFMLGHVAADLQTICDIKRADTHFYRRMEALTFDAPALMLIRYPELAKASQLTPDHRLFVAGYLAHLLFDIIWFRRILHPHYWDVPGWQAPFEARVLSHNTLLTYLDTVALGRLPAGTGPLLAAATPHNWLPFAADEYIIRWRDMLAAQLEPGAAIQTVIIYAERMKIAPETFQEHLADPHWMQENVFRIVPLTLLRQLLDDVVIQSIRYVENYLLEKNHD
ncbi:MAG: zinc dependent phospholipase C family protein [Anaerolineales bacterium]|nr:zinc dependent phospholipase C family protein [Anaerolineales bacterium]